MARRRFTQINTKMHEDIHTWGPHWASANFWSFKGSVMLHSRAQNLRPAMSCSAHFAFACCQSWHTYEWVMARVRMSHGAHTNKSWHACKWGAALHRICDPQGLAARTSLSPVVMAHVRMSHGTHTNESCHTYEWVMAHIWKNHGTTISICIYTWQSICIHKQTLCVYVCSDIVRHVLVPRVHESMSHGAHTYAI